MKDLRKTGIEIADKMLEIIRGDRIVEENVFLRENKIRVKNFSIPLNFENIYIVGFGKASGEMALALEKILGDRISGGIINTDHMVRLKNVKVHVCSHPLPDEKTVMHSREILKFLEKSGKRDLVIVLLSGGASSLFEVPRKGIALEEERKIVNELLKSGKDIVEINRVREELSAVKGGKLLDFIYPSKCLSLILSDVISHPEFVGSGPTYSRDKKEWVKNIVIGDNDYAKKVAMKISRNMGLSARISGTVLRGEPREIVDVIYNEMVKSDEKILIWGGEPTVHLNNVHGKGGREQELSLYLAEKIKNEKMCFVCIGTDGIDGCTDAAGGIVDGHTSQRLRDLNIDVKRILEEHNSYMALKKLGDLIFTGPTGTNLADICIGVKN